MKVTVGLPHRLKRHKRRKVLIFSQTGHGFDAFIYPLYSSKNEREERNIQ